MATILVDVDGTLIDSFPGIRASFLTAVHAVGYPTPDEEFTKTIAGPPMEQTLKRLGMDDALANKALEIYLEEYGKNGWNNSRAFPGMVELLDRLHAKGLRLCTATSKGEYFARTSLAYYGMLDQFDFIGAAQEGGPRRTKEAVIDFVLDELGHPDPATLLMVGDRSHDIVGAAHHGIKTVACTWGYGTADEWATAAWTATTPEELEAIIDTWATRLNQ